MTANPADAAAGAVVQRLRRLDVCAVSDALDRLKAEGVEGGAVVSGVPRRSGAGMIAGKVVTMRLGVGAPPPGPARHLGTAAIEASGSDDVIVVEQRTGVEAGCWGGLLTLGAKVRGVAGVVADGPVRDIDEARGLSFPVFSRALTARTARGRIVEMETRGPIVAFDTPVADGDFVIADDSAVIFLSASSIHRVLAVAETIVAKEAAMARAILSGEPISAVMGGSYEHMLQGDRG